MEGEVAFTHSKKCLERGYDKYYGDGDHNFIYCVVMGPNGKNGLGVEYSREPTPNNPNPYFTPEAIPKDHNDWKAFGSLFQYGSDADGHTIQRTGDTGNRYTSTLLKHSSYPNLKANRLRNWGV